MGKWVTVCVCGRRSVYVEGVCVPESGFIHGVHAFAHNVSRIYVCVCFHRGFLLMEMWLHVFV